MEEFSRWRLALSLSPLLSVCTGTPFLVFFVFGIFLLMILASSLTHQSTEFVLVPDFPVSLQLDEEGDN